MTPEEIEKKKEFERQIAEPWSEKIKWGKTLMIDHVSYLAWVKEVFPQLDSFTPGYWDDPKTTKVAIGDKILVARKYPYMVKKHRYAGCGVPFFLIGNRPEDYVMRRAGLDTFYGARKRGKAYFTDEVIIPALVEANGSDCWMSMTPNEVISQRGGVKKGRGTVLVGGMGMGWFARRVLERKKVTHVTVCDIDKAVLDYFGKPLKEEFGDKLTLVHGDIYDQDAFKFDSYLSDIWPSVNDSPDDRKFQAIKASHPNAWGWGYDVHGGSLW